jgi:hypothetical protein
MSHDMNLSLQFLWDKISLQNKGQELESTDLYFEAALKFLHVAFLLETPSFDISRPGDGARSMKMYSETAKLCK